MCNTSFVWDLVLKCIYGIILLMPCNRQGRKSFLRSKTKYLPDISRSNIIKKASPLLFNCFCNDVYNRIRYYYSGIL